MQIIKYICACIAAVITWPCRKARDMFRALRYIATQLAYLRSVIPEAVEESVSNEHYKIVDSSSKFVMYVGICIQLSNLMRFINFKQYDVLATEWCCSILLFILHQIELFDQQFKVGVLIKGELALIRVFIPLLFVEASKMRFKHEVEADVF